MSRGARRARCEAGGALLLCAATLGALLAAGPARAQQQDDLYGGERDTTRRPSRREKPVEVYVAPALPWRGPLPDLVLQITATCELSGEPVSEPAWADNERLVVAAEDPENQTYRLSLCRLGSRRPDWSVPLPAAPSGAPAADAERAYVGLRNGEIRAYSLEAGEEAWRSGPAAAPPETLARLDSGLAVGSSAGFTLLDSTTGALRFTADMGSPVLTSPVGCAGRWVFALGSGQVRALDPKNGRLLWKREVRGVPGPPSCDGGSRVIVGTSARQLVALSARSGHRAWRQKLGGAVRVPPVVHGGGVYAGAMDGRMYGLKERNGHRMWSLPVGERVRRAPVLVRGVLAVASAGDTRLSLIHLPTGSPLLEAEAPPETAGWVGAPVADGDRLALSADRRMGPDGMVIVYKVVER